MRQDQPPTSALDDRLDAIRWTDFRTAYGPAVDVPAQIKRLSGRDETAAQAASHELWCGLCHQHAQVASAALPAMPFLLEVLDTADRDLALELLDILLGFAIGVSRWRTVANRRAIGLADPGPDPQWLLDLRASLNAELARFRTMSNSPDSDVADSANDIICELEADGPAA